MGNGAPEPAVSVWPLADPQLITENATAIERAFREALGAKDPTRHRVTIAPGVIQHEDTVGMWGGIPGPLPSAAEAKAKAGQIIKTVTSALSPQGDPKLFQALGQMELMPARVQPVDTLQVASMDTGAWAHWLVRCRPRLPLSPGGEVAEVFGAAVEVRIGPAGAIVGYLCRWRPVLPERVEVALSPPPEEASEGEESAASAGSGGEAGGGSGEAPPPLYVLEGENAPQFYLSPYYPREDDDDLVLASACELSLVVTVVPYSQENPSQYAAIVRGGSGQYRFDWGTMALAEFVDGSIAGLGEGELVTETQTDPPSVFSVMTMPPGAHLALVNVVDVKTGGFQHHSEQVFVLVPEDSTRTIA
jgi:hypothetical protein